MTKRELQERIAARIRSLKEDEKKQKKSMQSKNMRKFR